MGCEVVAKGGVMLGALEPGDMTRYTASAHRWELGASCCFGELGAVEDGWLVVCGLNKRAHLFQAEGILHSGYVKEKLGLDNPHSIKHMTALIGEMLDRPVKQAP